LLTVMTCCAYCEQPATMTIVSNPERVCLEHAVEFWSGLLVYARDRRQDPCVKHEQVCTCQACEQSGESYLRTLAIAKAGPSPRDHERYRIRLAS
jgi:hypothetical protein